MYYISVNDFCCPKVPSVAYEVLKPLSPFQNVISKQQVVLVGDATVGKTHLLSRYVKSRLPKAWERSFISEGKGC